MNFHYSADKSVLMLLSLLKAYGIKRVIASPGAINIPVVASMQQDPYFEMYSCVDERSAAYMACGMAEETGEPVIINCTGATASRNYMPGLTEAFYRKLPVIALTCSRDISWIGHLYPQVTDRTQLPNDIAVEQAWLQTIKDEEDEWDVNIKINRALNALKYGPIHINVTDVHSKSYDVLELPEPNVIRLVEYPEEMPQLPKGKICIFCGEHKAWSAEDTEIIDNFCASHDAVVFVDHTSKYNGKYCIPNSIIGAQRGYKTTIPNFDIAIHIGEVSGGYEAWGMVKNKSKKSWRVNIDGHFSDLFHKLEYVFKMREKDFFRYYTSSNEVHHDLYDICKSELVKIQASIPPMPFSNLYLGQVLGKRIPDNSIIYLGILNTLRTWNFSEINPTVRAYSNTGGFGIDGTLSAAVGASLVNKEKLTFAVLGDLSFFYDMNCIGNHNVGNNLRILLINNGKGIEFRHYGHPAEFMGDAADDYVAAAGHWGKQSTNLVRHYVQDLGFKYLMASSKEELQNVIDEFTSSKIDKAPILLEVFTQTVEEQDCLKILREANKPASSVIKAAVKDVIGEKTVSFIKNLKK